MTQGSAAVSVVSASVPGAPTILTAVPASGKGVQLSWTAPTDAGGSTITTYNIYRSSSPSSGFALVTTLAGTTTSYKDTTTTRGATYYYEVTADNSTGESPPSNIAGPVTAK